MSELIEPARYQALEAALWQPCFSLMIDTFERSQVRWVEDLAGGTTAATRSTPVPSGWFTAEAERAGGHGEDASAIAWSRWIESTGEALGEGACANTGQRTGASPDQDAAPRRRVQRLVAIQAALGLTMQDLASALTLSRPQLYKWLDAVQDVRLQEAKRHRLDAIERLANDWQSRTAAPLRAVAHEPLADGGTVLDLLAAEVIDEAAVAAAFEELVGKLRMQPKSRSQVLAASGFRRRPSTRSLPSDE